MESGGTAAQWRAEEQLQVDLHRSSALVFIDHGEGAQEYTVCVLVLFMFNDTKIFIHFILAVRLHPSRLHSVSTNRHEARVVTEVLGLQ